MRQLIGPGVALVALVAGAAGAHAAPLFATGSPDESPRAELVRALDRLGHAQLEARAREIAGLTTRGALEARRARVRQTLLRLMGGLPSEERPPLGARVVGRVAREGIAIDKIVFE